MKHIMSFGRYIYIYYNYHMMNPYHTAHHHVMADVVVASARRTGDSACSCWMTWLWWSSRSAKMLQILGRAGWWVNTKNQCIYNYIYINIYIYIKSSQLTFIFYFSVGLKAPTRYLYIYMICIYIYLVGGDWNHGILNDFPFSIFCWEFHHPNWRTPSFFRGVGWNHQPDMGMNHIITIIINHY